MKRPPDYFGEAELDLIYMASRLSDALSLEGVLTAAGVDYLVETGTYTGGFFIKRDLTGAFFYVAPKDLETVRELLLQNSLKPYEPE